MMLFSAQEDRLKNTCDLKKSQVAVISFLKSVCNREPLQRAMG
jgi:hypothetical protein